MSAHLLGAYRPGTSWMHRLPAGAKLLGLFGCGLTLAFLPGWQTAVGGLAVALLVAASAQVGFRSLFASTKMLLLVMTFLGGYLAWQQGWERAVAVVGDLAALAIMATVLTSTTPVDQVLDAITRGLGPLRRVGVRPEQVALAFSLMLRGIPITMQLAHESRDAAKARGLQRDPRAVLRPMVVRVVAHARTTGEALHARGIGDD